MLFSNTVDKPIAREIADIKDVCGAWKRCQQRRARKFDVHHHQTSSACSPFRAPQDTMRFPVRHPFKEYAPRPHERNLLAAMPHARTVAPR
eukprot:6211902-Prymnesium_polylepis.1